VELFGLTIDCLSMDGTVARVDQLIGLGGIYQQVSVNVDKVVRARRDPQLRAIINGCDLVNADGQPVVWASRLLGQPLPERVTGVDLMGRLIAYAEGSGRRLYFLGAREEVVSKVVQRVRRDHPGAILAGARNGYWAPGEDAAVAQAVAAASPDILFLAIPSPAKERFLDRWKATMGARFVMGVGGSFDVYAGVIPRAPRLARRLGLEWLHRLLREPRRMWRRYLVDDLRFVPIVASEWLTTRRHPRPNRDGDGR
jgi:N-acetylglucosaminyldiphosphoundecaprenol N-acetyl-beta-D-mannosaminyltransferase